MEVCQTHGGSIRCPVIIWTDTASTRISAITAWPVVVSRVPNSILAGGIVSVARADMNCAVLTIIPYLGLPPDVAEEVILSNECLSAFAGEGACGSRAA